MKSGFLVVLCCCFVALGSCLESDYVTKDEFRELQESIKDIVASMREMKEEINVLSQKKPAELIVEELGSTFQNDTIEERVAVLEFQVAALIDDVTDLEEDLNLVAVEQVVQDEKILELELDSSNFEEAIENLVASDVDLYLEVGDVNSRVTNLNGSLNEVDDRVTELDTELTSLEDTLSQIDGRLSKLELSGTVAFQADLDLYTSIPIGSVVIFDVVDLNLGNGYNNSMGEFTVPAGGAGLYFFYINFYADDADITNFIVRVNGADLCYARADMNNVEVADNGTPSCGAVTTVVEGDVVDVLYAGELDDFPVNSDTRPYNTFTGFRIAPE